MKVLTVIGARPQFVKAAVMSRAFKKKNVEEIIIHTGQHYDEQMSAIFFNEMEIPQPAYNLQTGNLSHGAMTGRMMEKIEGIIGEITPDYVLVYGDTNSTLAAALAASKTKVKLVHVEAGLRSFNMTMPEEINRIVTDRLSDILFCPTAAAKDNLFKEGFNTFKTKNGTPVIIEQTGDVMKDAAEYFSVFAADNCSEKIKQIISGKYVICTLHRSENLNAAHRMLAIFEALNAISKEITVVFPMHPGTRKMVEKQGIIISDAIQVIDPVGFFEMLSLLKYCTCVFTDSGGLQKEAYFFKKPCITLRDETEWVELIENGYNKLGGANPFLIKKYFNQITEVDFTNEKPLYGEGCISDKIVRILQEDFRNCK